MKILVYTANFNNYDQIQYPVLDEASTDYLYFIDSSQKNRIWNFQNVQWKKIHSDPKRAVNYYKVGMHDLPDHDISLWVDSSMKFKSQISELINKFIDSNADLSICRHRWRDCVYDEGTAILKRKLDSPKIVNSQLQRYRKLEFPKNFGLLETTFILRKNNINTQLFNKLWYHEYLIGSRRDQLSVMYAFKNVPLKFMELPFKVDKNPYFAKIKHIKK